MRDRLRRLREGAGFTQREVAEAMDWSNSKVIRIESGNVGISVTDLRALLQHYGLTDEAQANELIAMARAAKTRPWWERYKTSASSQPFLTYLSYEGNASILRIFSPFRIPGLLQTEEYMREVFESGGVSVEDADLRAELRLERQERMLRPDGPNLNFILDENTLRRPVRSNSTMRRQLTHLAEISANSSATIRVMRFSDGMYSKCFDPYVILEFESAEEDLVLYLENHRTIKEGSSEASSGVPSDGSSPSDYLEVFFGLEQIANTERTRDLLQDAARYFT
ncbi:helix-turn-helix domain-containing protein (plasmid) [Streptomyces sp. AD2-2]|nr:helix-turn-helix domain-containing protein [Streptomyces sp. AD2-2]